VVAAARAGHAIARGSEYARRVIRGILLAALAVVWLGRLAGDAAAAPSARQRVVLADRDPELRHAMEQVLAPWHLEVVIESVPPADAAMAQERADADTARFVVWRDGEQLVVYDRELELLERRDSRSGVLDPPTAAAAALTIKTMMRLPPPPAELAASAGIAAPAQPAGIEVRLQAGMATRIARGSESAMTARFGGVAQIRPWRSAGWRFGLAGDGGTATEVSRASFKGTWREWAVLGVASVTMGRGAWEVEPHAGIGLRRSMLDGTQQMEAPRSERATIPTARGGVWLRWRLARWTVGAALDIDGNFSTRTYNRLDTPAQIFRVPAVGVDLGGVIAVDL
jgi:hypothetical protein